MKYLYIFIGIIVSIGYSCSGESSTKEVTEENIDEILTEAIEMDSSLKAKGVDEKLDYVIKNLKLSDEMIKILATEQPLFDAQILNDIANAQNYNTSKSKAVNMGIYGAELNYIIHFGQTQSSFKYLIASKQIADQLGVAMAFDQKIMDQYKNSSNNKDTLINIVYGAYDNVKKYMRNGDQFEMASLVIAGSWIENMYLVTKQVNLLENKNNQLTIYATISNQAEYLDKIIELLTLLEGDKDDYSKNIIIGLQSIDSCYAKIPDATHLNEENIQRLNDKIGNLRNSLTSM